ncbi:MAG: exodeoxyribonuclease VII large subunit, partial [Deltaproteobacteria bacterium]|nr:exodeoxyribonuclease VII large subunit [Deltaproteobacteria bacterium]
MPDLPDPRIMTVTDLTRSIRGILETELPFVAVTGEISNLRQPYSGHLYFTLKDESSQLKAVLFKQQQKYL